MLGLDQARAVLGDALKDAMSGSVVELQVNPTVSWTRDAMLDVLVVVRDWFEDPHGRPVVK